MARLKQLKQHDEIFYPITVGEAVIFKDSTNAEVSEQEMEDIFGWSGNYFILSKTAETDNYLDINSSDLTLDNVSFRDYIFMW